MTQIKNIRINFNSVARQHAAVVQEMELFCSFSIDSPVKQLTSFFRVKLSNGSFDGFCMKKLYLTLLVFMYERT